MNCESCERMTRAETKIDNLEGLTDNMDKKIDRVDGKIDQLKIWLMGVMAAAITSIFVNLVK